MRRRNFVKGIVGSAAAWPLAARAQQTDQVRRIGVLMGYASTDPEGQALLAEFTRHLAELGWAEGRNVRIDVRWGGSSVDLLHTFAKELIGLQPDVLLASSTPTTAALDNILRGAKPSELPVQMPVKYSLIINLKTVKALGITVPQTLLVAADEVIQ
jgi:putative ABC transport system substrate-binding protein